MQTWSKQAQYTAQITDRGLPRGHLRGVRHPRVGQLPLLAQRREAPDVREEPVVRALLRAQPADLGKQL